MEVLQKTVDQLGSLAEEVLLHGGDCLTTQRPQQLPRAEEGIITEKTGQS